MEGLGEGRYGLGLLELDGGLTPGSLPAGAPPPPGRLRSFRFRSGAGGRLASRAPSGGGPPRQDSTILMVWLGTEVKPGQFIMFWVVGAVTRQDGIPPTL